LLRISAGFSHQAALHDFVQPFAAAPSGLGVLTASALAVVLDEVAGPYDSKKINPSVRKRWKSTKDQRKYALTRH